MNPPPALLLKNPILLCAGVLMSILPPADNTDNDDEVRHTERGAPGAVGGGKGDSGPTLCSTQSKKEQLPFFSGIPSVEVVKGLLHLYKPKLVNSTWY